MSVHPGKLLPLPAALLTVLALQSGVLHAQEKAAAPAPSEAAQAKDASPLARVVVTGSRISKVNEEGLTPVTVIKAGDFDKLGYKNVGDVLDSLTQNTGFTTSVDYGNTFTPAANTLSIRGLGPNKTLILLNGRRVADYPRAYGGQVNFVNTATIPSALVDRIEVLSGGSSSIYGSDAVAAVINIILKKQVDGIELNLRAGGTELGGGENVRLQAAGGVDFGKLKGAWGFEVGGRNPIWARQRELMEKGSTQTPAFSQRDVKGKVFVAPPAGSCEAASNLFHGSLIRFTTTTSPIGEVCATNRPTTAFWQTQTGLQSSNLATTLSYELHPNAELYLEGVNTFSSTTATTAGLSWTSRANAASTFFNQNTNRVETWARRFAPEELGGASQFEREWRDNSYNLAFGVRGDIPNSNWGYDVGVNTGAYLSRQKSERWLAGIDEFYLGKQLGTKDGQPVYAPDVKRLFTPLNSDEADALRGRSYTNDKAWSHNFSASANGEVFDLPAGPVRAAVVAEFGRQGFLNSVDPRLSQGVFYNTTQTPSTTGSRDRYAFGTELRAPIVSTLTATASVRYDQYKFQDRKDGDLTYGAGLEFRPTAEILLRANHGTSFRAPDMNYLFTLESKGYYSGVTDYYSCALSNTPLDKCKSVQPNYVSSNGKDLKSEHGDSSGLGLVWAPNKSFDISVDYWRISVKDEVTTLDADRLLRLESDCRTGKKPIGSAECVDTLARITRNPADAELDPNKITLIRVNPINAASTATSGIDVSGNFRWSSDQLGRFDVNLKYNRVLSFKSKQFVEDEATETVGTRNFDGFPYRFSSSLKWSKGDWNHTLAANLNAPISSADRKSWLGPYWSFNLSSNYELSKNTTVGVTINNLLGSIREDRSGGWPNYPVGQYQPFGRQGWIQLSHKFGS